MRTSWVTASLCGLLLLVASGCREARSEPFAVTEIDLFSSVLASDGAWHQREASYPLFARQA